MAVSYLYGWSTPQKIGNSGPAIVQASRKILERYALEAADRARRYCPVDTGVAQHSITAQPDRTKKLTWWVGSNLPYMKKIEFLWRLGLPYSRNVNPNASAHCLSRGVRDIRDDFGKACSNAMKGTWRKI